MTAVNRRVQRVLLCNIGDRRVVLTSLLKSGFSCFVCGEPNIDPAYTVLFSEGSIIHLNPELVKHGPTILLVPAALLLSFSEA